MNSKETRQLFLDFFQKKSHKILSSAPILQQNDPSLLFINAGMNPFKDYFLGNQISPHSRIANTQKCLRVSGKHNDLDEVGHDGYHHTFFEMLGNWSFGDYFKKEAISMAWELLTEVYKISPELLYVSIFQGDEAQGIPFDSQAFEIWKTFLPEDKILVFGKQDNFWEMGLSGPCGPCSEIHIDIRDEKERLEVNARELVNTSHPQVIEIWNLVFIQYFRAPSGELTKLSSFHVDTGMGFERLCMVLQNKKSNYDTDVFLPLIKKVEKITFCKYKQDKQKDVAICVLVDHIRAICFAMADGALPSSNGAGYVIRRILRRAISYGFRFLDRKEPFLYNLVETLSYEMGEIFPELKKQASFIEKKIKEEEKSFFRTISNGINKINQILEKLIKNKEKTIGGKELFELYDTYGFPLDLSEIIAKEASINVDFEGFEKEMQIQKNRSKKASINQEGEWIILLDKPREDENFIGYDHLEAEVQILRYREIKTQKEHFYQLVFDQTPFYPKGGGQIGDSGFIENSHEKIEILDTQKENDLILHFCKKVPREKLVKFQAKVNKEKRENTQKNHSATHLLHFALRETLGNHVSQKGSYVGPDKLHFDFSHGSKINLKELEKIENLVEEKIREAHLLIENRQVELKEALDQGAMALFGEKYGEKVRMIKFGSSIELCGGTHVKNTREIGTFKILSESSVGAGIRRIEAITSDKALNFFKENNKNYQLIKEKLKNQKDPIKSIEDLQKENKSLNIEIQKLQKEKAYRLKKEWISIREKNPSFDLIYKVSDLEPSFIKMISLEIIKEIPRTILIIGQFTSEGLLISLGISKELIEKYKLNASLILSKINPLIGGKGGGQSFFATSKGKQKEKLEEAMRQLKKEILFYLK